MDINKMIELAKEKYLADEVLPYSHKKVDDLMEDGYFFSTVNYDVNNNWVDMIFMSLKGPVKCIILIAELKEE